MNTSKAYDASYLTLSLILQSDFKEIYEKHKQKIEADTILFQQEFDKIITLNLTPENIYENITWYIHLETYKIIKLYSTAKEINNTVNIDDNYAFKLKIRNPIYESAMKRYAKFFKDVVKLNWSIVRAEIVKFIYNDNKQPKLFPKGYKNDDFQSRLLIPLKIKDINEYCKNDYAKQKICKELNVIMKIHKLYKFYNDEYTAQKLNRMSYIVFKMLFLQSRYPTTVCDMSKLIPFKQDFTEAANSISITIYANNFPNIFPSFLFINKKFNINNKNYEVEYIKTLPKLITECNNKFIVINISIIYGFIEGHANVLIYNPLKQEVEVFEPQGYVIEHDLIYELIISDLFPKNVKYISQKLYTDRFFQDIQQQECSIERGHCASWSFWYVFQRLKYYKLSAAEAYNEIFNKTKLNVSGTEQGYTNLITDFVAYIKNKRKSILNKSDINNTIKEFLIKEWENENDAIKKLRSITPAIIGQGPKGPQGPPALVDKN